MAAPRCVGAGGVRLAGCALTLLLAAVAVTAAAADVPPSAAEVARERNEGRRIEARFNAEVATIMGLSAERVGGLLPDDRRITVRAERMIEALERQVRPLVAAEKSAIRAADERRREALGQLTK